MFLLVCNVLLGLVEYAEGGDPSPPIPALDLKPFSRPASQDVARLPPDVQTIYDGHSSGCQLSNRSIPVATMSVASFNPHTTIGAYELGVLVSYILLGVTTTQVYMYWSRFPNDPPRLRYLVALLWALEMAHAICIGCTLYQMTVSDYGQPERLILIPPSLAIAVVFSGIVGGAVQSFFAARIYHISKSLYIPCLSWTLSFSRLLGSIAVCYYGLRLPTIPDFEMQFGWLLNSLWSVASANDVLIAVTLVYWLSRCRREAGKRTVALVDKLIAWTMETGVVTSAAGVASLLCFATMKSNYIWIAFFVVNARLYSNSLLASLNSRASLKTMAEKTQSHAAGSVVGFKATGSRSDFSSDTAVGPSGAFKAPILLDNFDGPRAV
ncbi:hypothetical protein MSAN_01557000 [Mycena sanguinolenta]|uniref:DUF6534 domain-containing protein n=1 Tax=Mycena sanguinolenta TaxID=230812 RepID=A0A8H6XZL4_9AGAR|nr:hypothetical protein MSAN_01557000 [Mycena sanguinolenta]